jgi:hypothetical protein
LTRRDRDYFCATPMKNGARNGPPRVRLKLLERFQSNRNHWGIHKRREQ